MMRIDGIVETSIEDWQNKVKIAEGRENGVVRCYCPFESGDGSQIVYEIRRDAEGDFISDRGLIFSEVRNGFRDDMQFGMVAMGIACMKFKSCRKLQDQEVITRLKKGWNSVELFNKLLSMLCFQGAIVNVAEKRGQQ